MMINSTHNCAMILSYYVSVKLAHRMIKWEKGCETCCTTIDKLERYDSSLLLWIPSSFHIQNVILQFNPIQKKLNKVIWFSNSNRVFWSNFKLDFWMWPIYSDLILDRNLFSFDGHRSNACPRSLIPFCIYLCFESLERILPENRKNKTIKLLMSKDWISDVAWSKYELLICLVIFIWGVE